MKSGRAIIKTVESYECLIVPVKGRERKKKRRNRIAHGMIRWKIRGEGTGKARKIDKKIKKKKNILYLSSLRAGLKPASEVRSLFNGRVSSLLFKVEQIDIRTDARSDY